MPMNPTNTASFTNEVAKVHNTFHIGVGKMLGITSQSNATTTPSMSNASFEQPSPLRNQTSEQPFQKPTNYAYKQF